MCFHLSPQDRGSTLTPAPRCGFPALCPYALTYNSEPAPVPKMQGVSKAQPPRSTSEPPPSAELSRDSETGWGVHGSLPTQSHGPCFIFSPLPSRACPGPWTVGNKEPQCGLLRNPEQGHIRNPYREPKPVKKTAQRQCSLIASWAFSRLLSVR